MRPLARALEEGAYLSYAYGYPHKTAYRALEPEVDLAALWAREDRSALFLYVHVPFCEQRCGFCNLFTQIQPRDEVVRSYLAALERQVEVLDDLLAARTFARMAIGGGTPTFLSAGDLARVLALATRLGAPTSSASVEASPSTLDRAKVDVLREHAVRRVSLGVQSFFDEELHGVTRRQDARAVERAMALLVSAIPVRNLDLIYGLPGQTAASLIDSIERAIALGANELYLYPLYVRPLTILGRRRGWDDGRLALYRAGRDHLLARGWSQSSMRMFSSPDRPAPPREAPERAYRCQDDGMVGLGPGARSYTETLHYATPFAVEQAGIREIIGEYAARSHAEHARARHGFVLDERERRRRSMLLSLLDAGIDRALYLERHGEDVLTDHPELTQLVDHGLGVIDTGSVRLLDEGIERADVIGEWLQSDSVVALRSAWSPR